MDAQGCQRAIEACFPGFRVRSTAYLAEGWSSTVWEVNDEYVFRFPKRPEIAPGLRKETRLLPVLAPALPLPVPQFEYVWEGGAPHQGVFVGYRKIAGTELLPEHLGAGSTTTAPCSSATSDTIAGALGGFLTALHRFPLQEALAAGIAEGSPARWRAQYQAFYQRVRGRVFPLLRVEERQSVAAIWEAFLEDEANFCFYPVLIHRDLCGEHILYDAQRRTITGIIDWEDAGIGDPAQDFTGLLANFAPEFEAQVLAAYGGPPDARLLSRTRFYKAVVPFTRCCMGWTRACPSTSAQASVTCGPLSLPGRIDLVAVPNGTLRLGADRAEDTFGVLEVLQHPARAAENQHVGAGAHHGGNGALVDVTVHRDVELEPPSPGHFAQLSDLGHGLRHKGLSGEACVYRHHHDQVQVLEQMLDVRDGSRRQQGKAYFHPQFFGAAHEAKCIRAGLDVGGHDVGPGRSDVLQKEVWLPDGQMRLKGQTRRVAQRSDNHGAHGDDERKAAIHHVKVVLVAATPIQMADGRSQVLEICANQRERELEGRHATMGQTRGSVARRTHCCRHSLHLSHFSRLLTWGESASCAPAGLPACSPARP